MLYTYEHQRDLMFGHSGVPLFVSAQPVLMEFFPVSCQHCSWGPCRARRASARTASPPRAFSQSRKDPTINSCTVCPPSLRPLRLFPHMFGTLKFLVRVRPACLDGPCAASTRRARRVHALHLLLARFPNQVWIQPRHQLVGGRSHLQTLLRQVDGADLCSRSAS